MAAEGQEVVVHRMVLKVVEVHRMVWKVEEVHMMEFEDDSHFLGCMTAVNTHNCYPMQKSSIGRKDSPSPPNYPPL